MDDCVGLVCNGDIVMGANRKYSQEQRNHALAMLDRGASLKTVAAEVGASPSVICGWRKARPKPRREVTEEALFKVFEILREVFAENEGESDADL